MYYTQKQKQLKGKNNFLAPVARKLTKCSGFECTAAKIDMDYVDLNCNENGQRSFGFNIGISHSDERPSEKNYSFLVVHGPFKAHVHTIDRKSIKSNPQTTKTYNNVK